MEDSAVTAFCKSSIVVREIGEQVTHFDALIVGAGISGISAAYHLQKHHPEKTYAILEQRTRLGGTWDLFNYPGVRSDSDMYTFGFSFRHWQDDSAIAEKSKIIDYLRSTVEEFGIEERIEYECHIIKASWSSPDSRWQLTAASGAQFTCQFLFMCSGYYKYDQAYTPSFKGIENFNGDLVHPQFWTNDINYENKNVVVIGSGATAITLIPELAKKAKHVTMLQRSPTYIGAKPAVDPVANHLAGWFGRWSARWWFILSNIFIYWYSRTFPESAKKRMLSKVEEILGDKFEERHFKPYYNPWEQRVCLSPDADFFEAIKAGEASIETATIAEFSESGIRLTSGKELSADMIVTATGLEVQLFGGAEFEIDGQVLAQQDSYVYKGMMLSGVPNAFIAVGYTNASWTLKVDLSHRYASRLISYMGQRGYSSCCPRTTLSMRETPLVDLSSGYIQRALNRLPKQAVDKPWRLNQNYILDAMTLRFSNIDDEEMEFR